MTKYEPLQEHLKTLSQSVWAVHFGDVEAIIEGKLPKSAREHRAWWANNPTGHSHSKAWVSAGWFTEDVDMEAHKLVFKKRSPNGFESDGKGADPWGWLEGTVTILGDVDITKPIDIEWNAQKGKLHE